MKIEFEISDKSFTLLKDIAVAGKAEFKDSEFKSLNEFSRALKNGATEEDIAHFKSRNFCQLKDIEDLISHDLVTVFAAWHTTYIVTERGRDVIERYS